MRVKISHQLVLALVLSSIVITFFTTFMGAFQIYQKERARLDKQMDDLLKVDVQALAESIWVLDQEKIQKIIDQIYTYKPVDFIELSFIDESPRKILGFEPEESIIFSFDLEFGDVKLAKLNIHSDYERLLSEVRYSTLNNILNYFFLILTTSLLLFMVIHFLLTRHLLNISSYLKKVDLKKPDKLVLSRPELKMFEEDELAGVVESINGLVQKSYLSNENLEKLVKERTRALEEALIQVKKSSEIKTQFLANMSHEIRTPLNGVIGISDLLTAKIKDQSLQKYLQYLGESNSVLLKVVNDILDITKIEAGRVTLEKTLVNFPELVNDLLGILMIRASKQNIQLDCKISDRLPVWISSDPVRIKQVLTNVLDNALKFTSEGKIVFKCDAKIIGDEVEFFIVVADSGTGFDEERKENLFNIFTQEDDSTTRRFGGSGLGLSICKGILNLMKGSIDLNNRPEGGAECKISFVVPLYNEESAENSKNDSPIKLNDKVKDHILVVEDNEVNLELMRGLLEDLALHVTFASNGKEAIECCKKNFFPLILMDCHMPILDGYEASRRIRSFYKGSTEPYIIAVTASAMETDIKKCKVAGMNDVLTKPVRPSKLKELLKQLIEKKLISTSKHVA